MNASFSVMHLSAQIHAPPELSGENGANREDRHLNQLKARKDYDAVQCWLKECKHKETTYKIYQKETERFLLWCVYQQQNHCLVWMWVILKLILIF